MFLHAIKEIGKLLITYGYQVRYYRNNVRFRSGVRCYRNCEFEGYNVINDNTIVTNSKVGFGTYIGRNGRVSGLLIGKYCSIGSNLQVYAYTHPTHTFVSTAPCFYSLGKQTPLSFSVSQQFEECLSIGGGGYYSKVGNDVWIGNDVTIMGGVTIGDGAIIGTHAVVTKDVPAYAIAVGVPARIIRYRFTAEQIEFLESFCWWDRSIHWLKKHATEFLDIEKFIYKNRNASKENES